MIRESQEKNLTKTEIKENRKHFDELKKLYNYLHSHLEGSAEKETEFFALVQEKAMDLEEEYDNVRDYALFYILAGDIFPEKATHFDFKGEDSIEKFLKVILPKTLGIKVK